MLYQEARTRKEGLHINGPDEMVSSSNQTQSSPHRTAKNSAKLEALRRDTAFVKYLQQLEKSDYYKGQMKDSQFWKEQEKKAVEMWIVMRQAELILFLSMMPMISTH